MHEQRQRTNASLAAAFLVLGVLTACSARLPLPEPVSTAVATGSTAVAGAQTALPVSLGATAFALAQTAAPVAQATLQAGATQVGGALADPDLVRQVLSAVLGGASVELELVPPDARGADVQQVAVRAVDDNGFFAANDPSRQRAAATAAMVTLGQAFPNATIALTIVAPPTPGGQTLLSASKAPGAQPEISQ